MSNDKEAAAPSNADETIETTLRFSPKFGADGLIPAIVTDLKTGDVLMFAYMNDAALARTLASGRAHFWSRSRAKLWMKGEESGNVLQVTEIRTDCDQDVLWLAVTVEGDGVACHTGERSCFYRRISKEDEKFNGAALEIAALPHPKR